MSTLDQRVRTVVRDQLKITEDKITNSATLEDLGADSLDKVELVMQLEEEFGIDIPDEEAGSLVSIKDVIAYVSGKTV